MPRKFDIVDKPPYRIVDLTEGTDDFREWRGMRGIGGGDAASITGESPYQSAYQTWLIKTRRAERDGLNAAMQRGIDMEEQARKEWEFEAGETFTPVNLIHADYPFIRAQIDGWNDSHTVVVEIKCPGAKTHAIAQKGQIPAYYLPQLDHELMVSGAQRAAYWSYEPGAGGICIWYERNEARIQKLLEMELAFWNLIQTDTPPPLTVKDLVLRIDDEWSEAAEQYKIWAERAAYAQSQVDMFEDQLRALADGRNSIGSGVKVINFIRKGPINYKTAATELADVLGEKFDWDKYRSKETSISKVSLA